MRTWLAGVALAVAAGQAAAQCVDETYGTAVAWHRDPAKAAEKARADGRLVMVLHISGELDDAEKT